MLLRSYLIRILTPHIVQLILGFVMVIYYRTNPDPNKTHLMVVIFATPIFWWFSYLALALPPNKESESQRGGQRENNPKNDSQETIVFFITFGIIYLLTYLLAHYPWLALAAWGFSVFWCLIIHLAFGTYHRFDVAHGERFRQRHREQMERRRNEEQRRQQEHKLQERRSEKQQARGLVENFYYLHTLQTYLPLEEFDALIRCNIDAEELTPRESFANAHTLLRQLKKLVKRQEKVRAGVQPVAATLPKTKEELESIEAQIQQLEAEKSRQIDDVWESDMEANLKQTEVEYINNVFQQRIEQLRKEQS